MVKKAWSWHVNPQAGMGDARPHAFRHLASPDGREVQAKPGHPRPVLVWQEWPEKLKVKQIHK